MSTLMSSAMIEISLGSNGMEPTVEIEIKNWAEFRHPLPWGLPQQREHTVAAQVGATDLLILILVLVGLLLCPAVDN